MERLPIKSAQGDYAVEFFSDMSKIVQELRAIPNRLFVIDRNIERLYRKQLAEIFENDPVFLMDATEDEKSMTGVLKLATWMQEKGANKKTTLITFGGGIIQDISAFTAHVYYRGIRWVFVPTTLLAMSDSCIGAKNGLNLNAFKNQLGCFHSPSRVMINAQFTETLTDKDVASGYGEILKLMVTASEEKFDALVNVVRKEGLRNSQLNSLIRSSLEVKKVVIEQDEYEADLRRILNYGHTFGHALETLTDHAIPHGLAVAWGMDLVNYLAVQRIGFKSESFEKIQQFISEFLPFNQELPVDPETLIKAVQRDKKVAEGGINLILPARLGELKIVKTPFDGALTEQVNDYIQNQSVYAFQKQGAFA